MILAKVDEVSKARRGESAQVDGGSPGNRSTRVGDGEAGNHVIGGSDLEGGRRDGVGGIQVEDVGGDGWGLKQGEGFGGSLSFDQGAHRIILLENVQMS